MIPELAEVYINAIVAVAQGSGLRPMHQTGMQKERAGRVWFSAGEGTTVPTVCVQYAFGADSVGLTVQFKDDRAIRGRTRNGIAVQYAEGLDAWLRDFDKDLKAGLLGYKSMKDIAQEVL